MLLGLSCLLGFLQSSAKNHKYVTICTSPEQYPAVMAEMQANVRETRRYVCRGGERKREGSRERRARSFEVKERNMQLEICSTPSVRTESVVRNTKHRTHLLEC